MPKLELLSFRSSLLTVPAARRAGKGKQQKRFYRPELDALRFCAFLAVYVHHSLYTQLITGLGQGKNQWVYFLIDLQNACALGVPLFFTLSAYLITSLIQLEMSCTGELDTRKFYIRRVLRIWPLYFFALLIALVVGIVWPGEKLTLHHLIWFLLMGGNLYVLAYGMLPLTTAHLWSISVEEQFYLFWPLLARFLNRTGVLVTCLLIIVFSVVSVVLMSQKITPEQIWFQSTPHLIFFAAGSLLAVGAHSQPCGKSAVKAFVLLFFGSVTLFVAEASTKLLDFDFNSHSGIAGGYALTALGCVTLIYGALHMPARFVPHGMVNLGKISYGLYVYHAFVFRGLRNLPIGIPHPGIAVSLIALPITIVLAKVSYRFLEKPFLTLKARFETVASRNP